MLYVNPVSNLDTLRTDGSPDSALRRKTALQELDRLFAFTLLQEMRKTVPDDALFGRTNERRTYDEMLDDAVAGDMARTGQLGVARQVEAQLAAAELGAKRPVGLQGTAMPLERVGNALPLVPAAREAIPLRSDTSGARAYSLIKAPMPVADN